MNIKTHTKGVTSTQLGVAVMALFLSGSFAFASLPSNNAFASQKKQLFHDEDEVKLLDTRVYAEKMKQVPQSVEEVSQIIFQNKQIIAQAQKQKVSYDFSVYTKALDTLSKDLVQLQMLAKQKDEKKIQTQIQYLKSKSLPIFFSFQKSFQAINANAELVRQIQESQKKLIRALQIKFPEPLVRDFASLPPGFSKGNVHTAICITRWSEDTRVLDEATLRQQFQRVVDYYREISFGRVQFSLDAIVDNHQVWNGPLPQSSVEEINFAVEMCDSQLDFSQVDAVIVYPSVIAGGGLGASYQIVSEDGQFRMPMPEISGFQLIDNNLSTNMAHELGHAVFGLDHANRLECGEDTYRANQANCSVIHYGNPFDTMGTNFLSGHFSAKNKRDAGMWIATSAVQRDGNYVLAALEQDSDSPQLLYVPFRDYPLCIEYRKPIGLDHTLETMAESMYGARGIPPEGGILMNICRDKSYDEPVRNLLLDLSPHVTVLDPERHFRNDIDADVLDSFLLEGDVFRSDDLGITIQWQRGNDDNTASVQLDIDETSL